MAMLHMRALGGEGTRDDGLGGQSNSTAEPLGTAPEAYARAVDRE
jgi:hypothetical protein